MYLPKPTRSSTTYKSINNICTLTAVVMLSLASSEALASGTGMPWEGPLQQIVDSLTGPTAKAIGILMILGTALGAYFSEGGAMKKMFTLAVFLALGFSAATFIDLLGFSGGVGM